MPDAMHNFGDAVFMLVWGRSQICAATTSSGSSS